MSASANLRTGGQILIDCLRIHGADAAFTVPGESFLAALDALHDAPDIRLVTCRQEGGAAIMAEAYGKMTGRPGICFVTRGPGAANATAGLHIAFQDSTPMILFIGQIARDTTEREAFQEVDFRRMYGQMAKWVAQIDDPSRIPEFISRAFYTATAGRPGPVVLALPEDMLTERASAPGSDPYRLVEPHPGTEQLAELHAMLEAAERPFVILGGGGWNPQATADIADFATASGLPFGAAFRRQDLLDNENPHYVGDVGIGINPKLGERIHNSDLLLVLGARLGEMTTGGYQLIEIPKPRQKLVHVFPGAEELGRVYQPALAINAGMGPMAAALKQMAPLEPARWRGWTEAARAEYLAHSEPPPAPGALDLGRVMVWLRERLPAEAIICNGAGNYSVWVHRFYRYRHFKSQLAPTCGSMGYGVPAAVAAKLVAPQVPVVAFAGDGCFLMTGQELATAVQYGLSIVILVVNNGMYGTIRMHQERHYPTRVIGTDLVNPDFAAYAQAFGAHGETIARTEDFPDAFERALKAGGPALIELRIDPEAITPRQSLSQIRQAALGNAR